MKLPKHPDPPDQISNCADCNVDPSELFTENDSVVFTATIRRTACIVPAESKVSDSGEDNKGGMSVEDLQRGDIEEVQSGEEGEEKGGEK